jgi:hypothetical protein
MCLAKLDSLESEHALHGHLDQNLGKFIASFGIIERFWLPAKSPNCVESNKNKSYLLLE